tara:strand:+ start:697 stop:1554 length:858 start_codon:yes stop_codon:yes gene_type:complete
MKKIYKKIKKRGKFFSIVCATKGNDNQLNELCNSLNNQIYKNFELIICDQNINDKNKAFLKIFKNLQIKYIKSKVGLSFARNKGIRSSKGDFLIFLDDDIILKKNFLKKINDLLNKNNHNIIAYSVEDENKKKFLKYPKKSCYLINLNQIFNSISSVSFVINSKNKLFFDKEIGLGSKSIYQSGEETDYILRVIKKFKYKIYFEKSIFVIHKNKKINFIKEISKTFYYGCGWGYVVKKNRLSKKFIIKSLLKLIININYHVITFNLRRFIISISAICGRIFGLII